jgi:DNA polymerase III delta prime subunit
MAMALAEQLPASLLQLNGSQCTLKEIQAMRDRFAYYPPKGKFWICLVDEADQMTELAQLQLLSLLDSAATLKPVWGGGFERGEPTPVIWIFTCNGRGPQQLEPPASLLPRFRSRCLLVPFAVPTQDELAIYLERVWAAERGPATPDGYFDFIASEGGGVRDALMRLEVDLLSGPRAVPAPAEEKLRTYYNEQGIPKERQDAIIAEITAKARPGARVGPFTIQGANS